jgi:hypothetical protein
MTEDFHTPVRPENEALRESRHSNYKAQCKQRWHSGCLRDAKVNWHDFEEIRETLVEAMRQFKRNPGQEDLNGKFHNPDYSLTNFLWNLQAAIEPDRSCLHPLLDFEEHHQKCFLRRGLIIYCSQILRESEAGKGTITPALPFCPETTGEQLAPPF